MTFAIIATLIYEAIFFRRAIFLLVIPLVAVIYAIIAIRTGNSRYLWPMIAISVSDNTVI